MNRLIVASLRSGDLRRLISFPTALMEPFELELIMWIAEYNAKYGEPPSLDRLEEEFDEFIGVEIAEKFVLDDIADETLKKKRVSFFIAETSKLIDKTRETAEIPEKDLYAILKVTSESMEDEMVYSMYDRTKYWDRSHTRAIPFFAGILNKAIGDIHSGDYCLVVGRLGTGKSLIAQWQAREWMLGGLKVLFVSQEMLANEVFGRIDGMVASFNPLELRSAPTEEVQAKLKVAQLTARKSGGEIYSPKGLKTPEQIAMTARFFGVDVIIVDGVYQLAPDLMKMPPVRWERITEVSNQLKQMAMATKLPMLATTQIKRAGKTESFTPEDIAFADALGQDADQIIAIESDTVHKDRIVASIIKNRYGPQVAAMIKMHFETMTLEEVR